MVIYVAPILDVLGRNPGLYHIHVVLNQGLGTLCWVVGCCINYIKHKKNTKYIFVGPITDYVKLMCVLKTYLN